jgi:hypothetical protein
MILIHRFSNFIIYGKEIEAHLTTPFGKII